MANSAWLSVQLAREFIRPTAQYFIENIFDDFVEMHGDKLFGDDAAILGGIGFFDGTPVTVIGQEKGRDVNEKVRRNFGSAHPEGYRKSLRLMRQAEKFHRPVICIVDTQGAYCGVGAEERGIGEAIARNLLEMSRLRVPVLSIIIGEGGSGGALALAVPDRIAMLENSVYSILPPEGFANILWRDPSKAPEAAQFMRMTAKEVKEMGIVDDVIAEPKEGAKNDDGGKMAKEVKKYIADKLPELMKQPMDTLLKERYDKIRAFGQEYLQNIKK
jgi:acetyl-CoA carboxylase carboxyl transferase subunit alpha